MQMSSCSLYNNAFHLHINRVWTACKSYVSGGPLIYTIIYDQYWNITLGALYTFKILNVLLTVFNRYILYDYT